MSRHQSPHFSTWSQSPVWYLEMPASPHPACSWCSQPSLSLWSSTQNVIPEGLSSRALAHLSLPWFSTCTSMGLRPPAPCITLQCGHGPLKAARPVTLASTASPFSALGRMKHSDCHTKISTSGISSLEAKPSTSAGLKVVQTGREILCGGC